MIPIRAIAALLSPWLGSRPRGGLLAIVGLPVLIAFTTMDASVRLTFRDLAAGGFAPAPVRFAAANEPVSAPDRLWEG